MLLSSGVGSYLTARVTEEEARTAGLRRLLMLVGRSDEGAAALMSLLQDRRTLPGRHGQVALALVQGGQVDRGLAVAAQALELYPRHAGLQLMAARVESLTLALHDQGLLGRLLASQARQQRVPEARLPARDGTHRRLVSPDQLVALADEVGPEWRCAVLLGGCASSAPLPAPSPAPLTRPEPAAKHAAYRASPAAARRHQ